MFTIIIPCGKINSHCQQCCNLDLECFYNAFFLKYNVLCLQYCLQYFVLSQPCAWHKVRAARHPARGAQRSARAVQHPHCQAARALPSEATWHPARAAQHEARADWHPAYAALHPARSCVWVSEIVLRCRFSYLLIVLSCPVTVQQTYVGFCCIVEDLFQVSSCCQVQPIWMLLLD